MNSFVLSRISKGEITNLEISVVFLKKVCAQLQSFFLEQPNLQTRNQFLMKFLSVCRAGPPFFASSLCHDLFIQTFSQFPYQKCMVLCMNSIYPGQVAGLTGNVKCHDCKCQMYSYLVYVTKKRKKYLYGPFLRMGFNCLKAKATSRRQFIFYH